MPSLQKIRFQKYDKYSNPVFIASSKKPDESKNYETLKDYAEKLEDKQYDTYLPIYNSQEYNYSSIRFCKSDKYKTLSPNAKYNIDYKIMIVTRDEKIYVNCYIQRIRMVEKAPKVSAEVGSELIL
jgi:hypothetical protein